MHRSLKRHVVNALTALSLVLCLAALVLWSNSSVTPRMVKLSDGPAGGTSVAADAGRLTYFHIRFDVDPNMARMLRAAIQPGIGGRPWRHGGFELKWRVPLTITSASKATTVGEWTTVSIPLWALAAAGAVLPGAWAVRHARARHRRRRGGCPRCGYDLRGTPGKCPECGAVAS